MIKVSAGTAERLKLKEFKIDDATTTAYLLDGDRCCNNCGFCPQARESESNLELLARIIWPSFSEEKVLENLKIAYEDEKIKRVCVQVTNSGEAFERSKELVKAIREQSSIPISVASNINNMEKIRKLLEHGANKVCVAMDAATEKVHSEVKGNNYHDKKKLLKECAKEFKGKLSTHFIVGLGETEEEILREIQTMYNIDVTVGLFAFTPIKGTRMANWSSPEIGHYRRVQIANYLLKNNYVNINDFQFEKGTLIGIQKDKEEIISILSKGEAFQTAGCPECNRPYYNEKPGGIMYNYPRSLEGEEVKEAIKESQLFN